MPLVSSASISRILGLALGLILSLLFAASAPAAPLSGSNFDGADGDQASGAVNDWQDYVSSGKVAINDDPSALDGGFQSGAKEEQPDGWSFTTSAGGVTPGKSNILATFVGLEPTASTSFLHLAFKRQAADGVSFLTFELNQRSSTWVNAAGVAVPCRSTGDLIVSFETDSPPSLKLYRWVGTGGPAECPEGRTGSLVAASNTVINNNTNGSMNLSPPHPAEGITNYIAPGTYGAAFGTEIFGEASVNISGALSGMGTSPCVAFVQISAHSRSSTAITSNMVEYTDPSPVRIRSCSVAGSIYNDSNADGDQDAGETGLAGRTVFEDANSNSLLDEGEKSTTTASNGSYALTNISGAGRNVRILPQGWTCSAPASCSRSVTVPSGGNAEGQDFGIWTTGTISGSVFDDADADGVKDSGEAIQSGVRVYLDDNNNDVYDSGSDPSQLSDASGNYAFTGITPGAAKTVRMVTAAGQTCSAPAGCEVTDTLDSGETVSVVFGSYANGNLAGNLFLDADGDGVKDFSEGGLVGWDVYSDDDFSNSFSLGDLTALTDADGDWSLGSQTPGTYRVRVSSPGPSWICSSANGCDDDEALASNETTALSYGYYQLATVSGTVLADRNHSGSEDAGDTGRSGLRVYVDLDGDGSWDSGSEPSDLTDVNGDYELETVPGDYELRVEPDTDWDCSAPSDCDLDINPRSGTSQQEDFLLAPQSSISGQLVADLNANGAIDSGETGISGQRVFLDSNGDGNYDSGSEPEDTTDATGNYAFSGLADGSYSVRLQTSGDTVCSLPCAATLSVVGPEAEEQDFATYQPSDVTISLRHDLNADGVADSGESSLSGHTVFLDEDSDNTLDAGSEESAVTDSNGEAVFSVAPGAYRAAQVRDADWQCHSSECWLALTATYDGTHSASLSAWQPATLSGVAREDRNADGAVTVADPALTGRRVFLDLDDDNSFDSGTEASVLVAADGSWSFSGLTPGSYKLRMEGASGWTCGSCSADQTLTSGQTSTHTLHAWRPVEITGLTFHDLNADGDRDSGEPVTPGRTVFADADNDGILDTDATPEISSASATDGSYTLSLRPGTEVRIRQQLPASWQCDIACATVHNANSGTQISVDLGSWQPATLSGVVREDRNNNGQPDVGEPALAGQQVYLDTNNNSQLDGGESSQSTAVDGRFSFSGLRPGPRSLRLVVGSGWVCGPVSCGHSLTLISADVQERDFAAAGAIHSLSGVVREDMTADDSLQDDPALDQIKLFLDADDDAQQDATESVVSSASDGSFRFDNLMSGTHRVRLVAGQLEGDAHRSATLTLPSSDTVTLGGWRWARLDGSVFGDSDADSKPREDHETARSGQTVFVDSNSNGQLDDGEPTSTSDASGKFSFERLRPGSLKLSLSLPAKWHCSYPVGCAVSRSLTSGQSLSQPDALGSWQESLIQGLKFEDQDGDGSRFEKGDPVLAGWTVYADLNRNGKREDIEPFGITDAEGKYGISGLPVGSVLVRERPPVGSTYRCSYPSKCSYEAQLEGEGKVLEADFGAQRVVKAPRSRLHSLSGCRPHAFTARVSGQGIRSVRFAVDGKRVKLDRRPGKLSVRLQPSKLSYGFHRLTAKVVYRNRSIPAKTLRSSFYRCRPVDPNQTG